MTLTTPPAAVWLDATRRGAAAVLLVAVALGAFGVFAWRTRPDLGLEAPGKFDFFAYFTAARLLREDPRADLYDPETQRRGQAAHLEGRPGGPYRYPPFFAWMIRPLGRFPPPAAAALWSAWTLLSVAAGLVFVALAVPSRLGVRRVAVLVIVAALYAPLADELYWGQVNGFLFALLALAAFALTRGRERVAGGALGIAAAVKITPLLLVPVLAWKGYRKTALAALAAVAVCLVLPMLTSGFEVTRIFFTEELPRAGSDGQTVHLHQSLSSVWLRLTTRDGFTHGPWDAPAAGRALALASHLAVAVLTLLALARVPPRSRDPHRGLLLVAALIPAVLLVSPYVWFHHYVLLLLPLGVLALLATERAFDGRPGALVAFAALYALVGFDGIYQGPLPARGMATLTASRPVLGLVLVWLTALAVARGGALAGVNVRRIRARFTAELAAWRRTAEAWSAAARERVLGHVPERLFDRRDAAVLGAVLALAAFLRAADFIGFGLGDDPIYQGHIVSILDGRYPSLDLMNQYAYRPLLLVVAAASVALFGLSNWGFVAPFFLTGLAMIALAYTLGKLLGDRFAAFAAALLLAVFPLHAFDSVTFTNDLLVAAVNAAGVVVFLLAVRARRGAASLAGFALAGVLLTAAYLAKMTGLVAGAAFALATLWLAATRRGPRRFHAAAFWIAFGLSFAAVLAVYHAATGDALRHFHAEKHYYAAVNVDWDPAWSMPLADVLLDFPRKMFQGQDVFGPWGEPLHLSPFGPHPFVVVGALALGLGLPRRGTMGGLLRRHPGFGLAVAWMGIGLLVMEFSFTNLDPHFIPSPRIERYLEIAAVPAVLVAGLAFAAVRLRFRRTAAALLAAAALWGLADTRNYLALSRDAFRDVHLASDFLLGHEPRPVFTDGPARAVVGFRLAADERFPPVAELPADPRGVPPGAAVAVCGARSFLWSPDLVRCLRPWEVPAHWRLVHVVEPALTSNPLRSGSLLIYDVLDE